VPLLTTTALFARMVVSAQGSMAKDNGEMPKLKGKKTKNESDLRVSIAGLEPLAFAALVVSSYRSKPGYLQGPVHQNPSSASRS